MVPAWETGVFLRRTLTAHCPFGASGGLLGRGPDMGWPEWAPTGISPELSWPGQWLALLSYVHPGQPRAWSESQQRWLYPLGPQGVRMWVHSGEGKIHKSLLEEETHCTGQHPTPSLGNCWKTQSLSPQEPRLQYPRKTFKVNATFHQDLLSKSWQTAFSMLGIFDMRLKQPS